MRTYGQYCPIARASEILAERWTLLIVRNLLLGMQTFTQIARGVPGMSRTLLTQRLRMLVDAGVLVARPKGRGGGGYELTEAGRALQKVIEPLSTWGQRWLELRAEHSDPSVVLWAWVEFHLAHERLPTRRVVVEFEFPEQPTRSRRFWVLFQRGATEVCYSWPGFENDLIVTARSEAFTRWHVGKLRWPDALRAGDIRVEGQ